MSMPVTMNPPIAVDTLLRVRDLEVHFLTKRGVARAVDGVSFDLAPSERLAIVGESGSGKSVLSMALMGLVAHPGKVVGGQVELMGTDMRTLDERRLNRIRGKDVAMVFQDPMSSLNPVLTVEEQITAPLKRHLNMKGAEARARALELLQQVGIPAPAERLKVYPHQLSGGMRQRVLLAMALACGPKLLLADEPTTALDVTVQAQIIALLNSLAHQLGMAVIFVTHDLGLVARFADRVAVMYAGRFVEIGATRELFAFPQHPYTRGLLASIPAIAGERPARLAQIPGSPPDILNPGPGCPFEPRCAYAVAHCAVERPPLLPRDPVDVACWVDADAAPSRTLEVAHA
jgi:peptide/nickel transport system ATP-binding protein